MTINMKKNAIEMTKKFAAAAAKFGSDEYLDLQTARRDYPTFKVVTISRKTSAQKESYKGLTYEYMERYIQKHDVGQQSGMAEYKMLRGLDDENPVANPYSYMEMKDWFLKKYPDVEKFNNRKAS